MFDHKPTPEEVSKWFSGFQLHDGLKHEQYVGGIVVIENKDRGTSTWVPYVNATSRIAYFWDWVDMNGYLANITVGDPHPVDIELPGDKKARQFWISADVCVEHEIPGRDADGRPDTFLRTVRFASGRKQVSSTKIKRGWNGAPDTILADTDALMKAETGAIARALGTIGMLALPGSGLATAEDMNEYLRESAQQSVDSEERPKTKAAPNPKK